MVPAIPRGVLYLIISHLALFSEAQVIPRPKQNAVTDYAPITQVDCPDISTRPLLRRWTSQNQTLHPQEVDYINTRASTVLPKAWEEWIGTGSQIGYNVADFRGNFPKIGIAVPGGGLRAAQYGAACLEALDARNDTAKAAGTGGLLQVSSYISGLSGGSWITGSLFFNGWPTLSNLVFGDGKSHGWMLDLDFVMPDGSNIFSEGNQAFFGSILWSVMAKAKTGIDTSLVDPWSRIISYRFLNQTTRDNILTNSSAHGAGQLWSDIPKLDSYKNHQTPFPIVVADSRPVGSNLTTILGLESVVYEITPLELASYDPQLSAGMNLTYVGTRLTNGVPESGDSCVVGLDQAGFVMGTSAGLFNQILDFATNTIRGFEDQDAEGILYLLARLLSSVRSRANDVANWPSPFTGINPGSFQDSDAEWLELIDGASNVENIPYGPLFVKARGLDVIVTAENSADILSNNWPNGTALIFTKSRIEKYLRMTHQFFPPIPGTAEDFIETGVNARPTFFGCDPRTPDEYPLVIYLPSAPPINGDAPVTNTPTFQLQYSLKHTRKMFDQIHTNMISGFVPNTNDADPNWGKCLQCAAIDRARLKVTPPVPRSQFCSACFKQYCYDRQNPPNKSELPNRQYDFVDPDPKPSVTGFIVRIRYALLGGFVGLAVFIGALIAFLLWWKKRQNQVAYSQVGPASDYQHKQSGLYHDSPGSYEMGKRGMNYSTSDITIQPPSPTNSGYGKRY